MNNFANQLFAVPLTVGFDYHCNNWGEGVEL